MAIKQGWSFDRSSGFTGSADSGKTPVRAHDRSVQCYAKGGKVEGKSTTPPPRPQKHYDRMENFRKERDAEPAAPAKETATQSAGMKKGGKAKKYATGGEVSKALAKDSTIGLPGGDGTKNVVGFKKGGKAKGHKSSGKSSAAAQQKAAGALAQIAAATQGAGPIAAAPGGMAAPPAGLPGMGGPPPPGMPGMKRGGKASKSSKKK